MARLGQKSSRVRKARIAGACHTRGLALFAILAFCICFAEAALAAEPGDAPFWQSHLVTDGSPAVSGLRRLPALTAQFVSPGAENRSSRYINQRYVGFFFKDLIRNNAGYGLVREARDHVQDGVIELTQNAVRSIDYLVYDARRSNDASDDAGYGAFFDVRTTIGMRFFARYASGHFCLDSKDPLLRKAANFWCFGGLTAAAFWGESDYYLSKSKADFVAKLTAPRKTLCRFEQYGDGTARFTWCDGSTETARQWHFVPDLLENYGRFVSTRGNAVSGDQADEIAWAKAIAAQRVVVSPAQGNILQILGLSDDGKAVSNYKDAGGNSGVLHVMIGLASHAGDAHAAAYLPLSIAAGIRRENTATVVTLDESQSPFFDGH